ncbi:hypothetical protein M3202_18480 [Alkalihalobacillus oceani]|uniref:Uncharacterized protein n=1 Tax=Halalkalibacter oceani TaxID=1653776 RepID=A0A9X2DT96_9BACI|nr:hypothetical protein [Halalkalibacter oceani]MCM3716042.1 hypothetical protein [Halalkalibacter oceani]
MNKDNFILKDLLHLIDLWDGEVDLGERNGKVDSLTLKKEYTVGKDADKVKTILIEKVMKSHGFLTLNGSGEKVTITAIVKPDSFVSASQMVNQLKLLEESNTISRSKEKDLA